MLIDSGYFLWVTLSAAVICLVSLLVMMIAFFGSATSFQSETAATFALLQECLSSSLYRVGARETRMEVTYYRQLHNQLLRRSIMLNESYSQAAFELRIGRLSRMSSDIPTLVRTVSDNATLPQCNPSTPSSEWSNISVANWRGVWRQ